MQSDIITLICRLTPSKPEMETLPNEALQTLKHTLRADPSLNQPAFSFIQQRSKYQSSQVRFLLLKLINYLFCRSAHFRSIFCRSYVVPLMENFTINLPPPERLANKLKEAVKVDVFQWCQNYGHIYKQLSILEKEINPKISKEINNKKDHDSYINDLADVFILQYTNFFKEMQFIIDLMDKDKSDFVMPSEEYQEIVIEQIKERKAEMERCEKSVNKLKSKMISYNVKEEVRDKVLDLYNKYNEIEEAVRQIGAFDDEFEDIASTDEENIDNEDEN